MLRRVVVFACVLAIVSAACSEARAPGPTDFVAGGDRPVTVHVPPTADAAGAPLLIVLHGYTASGAEMEDWLRLGEAADQRGVVWAFPDGTTDVRGDRFWNATDACCGFGSDVDDSTYLAGLVDEIAATTAIDPKRVYFVGHSNGGFMSHRMACDHADKVTAIVSISGVTFVDPADCAASRPVAVLQIHGTDDETIRYEGGTIEGALLHPPTYPGAVATADSWLTIDRCDAGLTETTRRVDVDAKVAGPDGPAETTVSESTACVPGGHVELWTMHGVGHVPAPSATLPDAILDFLLAQSRP